MRIGIDIGSTTIKLVVLDSENKIVYKIYQRHNSEIYVGLSKILSNYMRAGYSHVAPVTITGSSAMGISDEFAISFVQEVIAGSLATKTLLPGTEVIIEIGGEDQKITFLKGHLDQRMNGVCAGGTGAFIDQMSELMNMEPYSLNMLAKEHKQIYSIASRCGVFAKTDIQSLLNQGARLEDISASIFQAVVNQTIAGLAQGRRIEGKVVFLGGPLTFLSELRERFVKTLELKDHYLPDDSEYFIAIGAALSSDYDQKINLVSWISEIQIRIKNIKNCRIKSIPLFNSSQEIDQFKIKHERDDFIYRNINDYIGNIVIGIDAGSTTTKVIVISEKIEILYQKYTYNNGKPIETIREILIDIYEKIDDRCKIISTGVTGYGESLIKQVFSIDVNEVETLAHKAAAVHVCEDVDLIVDIGGQDMKLMSIVNGQIDSIILNEACSSGCGSFISTFSESLGYDVDTFSRLAYKSKSPSELGSRCTIFMNSNIRQAQKNGDQIEDISAGLAISVVKNALYKVFRVKDLSNFGENIIVQGGTFNNDAVLRAFEKEIKKDVIRPNNSELMGALGIALIAIEERNDSTKLLGKYELENMEYIAQSTTCDNCMNKCVLSILDFTGGKKVVHGNRCSRGIDKDAIIQTNFFEFKLSLLEQYKFRTGSKTIGIPLVLNMYENLPFWTMFFSQLGLGVLVSNQSTKKTYERGQYSIPSDTVCYPGKIVHGHIEELVNANIDYIFYPCMTFNFDDNESLENNYNCPIVAYYPEVIYNNISNFNNKRFLFPYLSLNKKDAFTKQMKKMFCDIGIKLNKSEINQAYEDAVMEYLNFKDEIRYRAYDILEKAKKENAIVIVLAGRPYHVDPEINHGIAQFLESKGVYIVTEDSLCEFDSNLDINVLNQWTYHSRLYYAAQFVANLQDQKIALVQLVSFGCGLDAITVGETKRIVESTGKFYAQIKIDEMSNLGAIKIRLRSLISVIGGSVG